MNKSTFRKLIVVLCVAISILLVVCACGDGNDNPETTPAPETTVAPVETTAADTTAEDTTVADTTAEDTTVADTTAEDTTAEDTTAEDTTAEDTTAASKTLYVVNVTDEKGKNLAGVTVQFCVGDTCQIPQTTNAFGTVMVELDKADYTVKVTLEGYSGEDSYTFPEGSGTLNVVLTNLNPEPETTTAEPETTTAAPETTKAPETTAEPETIDPNAETEIVIEPVYLTGDYNGWAASSAGVHNAVGSSNFAMQFNIGQASLKQFTVYEMASFEEITSGCENTWNVTIFQWNTDYNTTVSGEALWTLDGTNHQNMSNFVVDIPDDEVITGEILVVVSYVSGPTGAFTGWACPTDVEGYTCYLSGLNDLDGTPVADVCASIVVERIVVVDPDAPVIPEFEITPYDKDYYSAKGTELIGIQWIQYVIDHYQDVQAWGDMGVDGKNPVKPHGPDDPIVPVDIDPYVIPEGTEIFMYHGWIGVADTLDNPGMFGFSLDGAVPFYSASFTTEANNEGANDITQAVTSPACDIIVPLTDLYGYHQFQIFYKSAAGVVVELDRILVFIEGEPEVPVLGSEENPIFITPEWNDENTAATATVTAPVGTTYYAVYGAAGLALSINGDEPIILTALGIGMVPAIFPITNDGDAEAVYVLTFEAPVGTMDNPEAIEELSGEVNQAAGNSQGYYYLYTATADGYVTVSLNNYPDGYICEIELYNLTSYTMKTLSADGENDSVSIFVHSGDQLRISLAAVEDAGGNWYPAAIISWSGSFEEGTDNSGTADNPLDPMWIWDDEYANATYSVTVAAGETMYLISYYDAMILTVDGAVVTVDENGIFTITNDGEEEATYELALATPVGAYNNPEAIENLPFEDEKSLAEDGEYCYTWTAPEDMTIVLTVTAGANIEVENPDTWDYYALAEIIYDDDYIATGWDIAENLVIEVLAGQKLLIKVIGLTDLDTYTTPATDYTLNITVAE